MINKNQREADLKYKWCNCPKCGAYGKHYWHHVFNGALKEKSKQHDALIYWCWACHVTNKDSIHNDAELRLRLKKEHQIRIMEEYNITEDEFRVLFYKSYLYE